MILSKVLAVLDLGCVIVLVILIKQRDALQIEPAFFLSKLTRSIDECIRCFL